MRRIALAAVFLLLGGASMPVAPALASAQSGYSVTPTRAGAAVNVTTTTLGNADITFPGTTGERIFIDASSWDYTGPAYLTITNPDGSTFVSDVSFNGNGDLGYYDMGETTLPHTGTYTAIWDPPSTGSVTLTFYKVPADASYSVTPSQAGAAKPVSTGTPGQDAKITFSGSAGERIFIQASSWDYTGPAYLTITNPDGSTFVSDVSFNGNGDLGYYDMGETTLPQTGTYSILWDPYANSAGTTTLTFYKVPADASYSVTPSQAGAAKPVSTGTPGQDAKITFSGSAGERIFIQASSWDYTGPAYLTITNPDGSTFVSDVSFNGNGDLGYYDMGETTLPQTGTYSILWDPYANSAGTTTLTFYKVPADASYSVTPSQAGAAKPVSTGTPGQNAKITFSGSAGERIFIQASSWDYTGPAYLTITNPDGSTFVSDVSFNGNGDLGYYDMGETTLPQTGTYSILWDPYANSAGTTTLTFYKVPADASYSVTPSQAGAAKPVSTGTPGQNAKITFSGSAGERIFIQASSWDYTGPAYLTITNPDGSTFVSDVSFNGNGDLGYYDMGETTLPQTGTYSILWDPYANSTGTTTLTFYKVPADFSGKITIGGAAETVTIGTPGQNGKVTFSGTASEDVQLTISGVTIPDSEVAILNPSGTTLTYGYFDTSGGTLSGTLGTTGTYTIMVAPEAGGTGSMTLTLAKVS